MPETDGIGTRIALIIIARGPFQTYLPIWNLWYGYNKMPELAAIYEENALELMEQYTSMFDRQGRILMWGRAISTDMRRSPASAHSFC